MVTQTFFVVRSQADCLDDLTVHPTIAAATEQITLDAQVFVVHGLPGRTLSTLIPVTVTYDGFTSDGVREAIDETKRVLKVFNRAYAARR
jgi:hypothetical protein